MLLHASHAAQHGHHAILNRTVDTDVVVLSVSLVQESQSEDKLWLVCWLSEQAGVFDI